MDNLDNIFNKPVLGVAGSNMNLPIEERKSSRSLKEISNHLQAIRNSKKVNSITETVNKNTQPYNENFPSLEGLPEPSQGSVPEGTTGTGKGGEIVTKCYSKTSSINNILENARYSLNKSNLENIEAAEAKVPSFVDRLIYKYKNSGYTLDKVLNRLSKNFGTTAPTLVSGAAGALLGGLGGLAFGATKSLGGAKNPNYKKNAIIGSILGSILGSGYGYLHDFDFKQKQKYARVKKAFAMPPFTGAFANTGTLNPLGAPIEFNNMSAMFNTITNKIMSDFNLNVNQKYELISYIKEQPSEVIKAIYSLVNTAAGAGIGYLISNYLLGLGMRGNIIMSLVGGLIGNSLTNENNSTFSLPSGYTDSNGNLLQY